MLLFLISKSIFFIMTWLSGSYFIVVALSTEKIGPSPQCELSVLSTPPFSLLSFMLEPFIKCLIIPGSVHFKSTI